MSTFENRIRSEFGPCEDDAIDAVIAVMREAVAAEREACAKLVETWPQDRHYTSDRLTYCDDMAADAARSIRDRPPTI